MPGKPSTMDTLWAAIEKAWDEMPEDIVGGFIESFETRRGQKTSARHLISYRHEFSASVSRFSDR